MSSRLQVVESLVVSLWYESPIKRKAFEQTLLKKLNSGTANPEGGLCKQMEKATKTSSPCKALDTALGRTAAGDVQRITAKDTTVAGELVEALGSSTNLWQGCKAGCSAPQVAAQGTKNPFPCTTRC